MTLCSDCSLPVTRSSRAPSTIGAKTLENFWPDDDVGDAGLVLERGEDHARRGARALADEHEAGDGDAPPALHLRRAGPPRRCRAAASSRRRNETGCAFKRERERAVVAHHMLAERHQRQLHLRLRLQVGSRRRRRRRAAGARPPRADRARAPPRARRGGRGRSSERRRPRRAARAPAREMPERSQRSRTLAKGVVARRDEQRCIGLAKALDLAEAETDGVRGADGGGLVDVAGVEGANPPPLWGRVWERGVKRRVGRRAPLPTPPHKGEGSRSSARGRGCSLQRRIPIRKIDVHLAHLDAVLARVADELGGGVEAHRLGVQERGAEDVGVAALDPGGGVDEEREARRVAFRKAVFAKALDLAEAALGEAPLVAARDHALDHLRLEQADGADAAEGRHGAAQLVGLARLEFRRHDGDLHRLLLEERHAERLCRARSSARPADRASGRGLGIVHLLDPLPAAEIGMHHVALDRAGADDRHLDDEVVEGARAEAAAAWSSARGSRSGRRRSCRRGRSCRRLPAPPSGSWRGRASRRNAPRADRSRASAPSACRARARRSSASSARRDRPCPIR